MRKLINFFLTLQSLYFVAGILLALVLFWIAKALGYELSFGTVLATVALSQAAYAAAKEK